MAESGQSWVWGAELWVNRARRGGTQFGKPHPGAKLLSPSALVKHYRQLVVQPTLSLNFCLSYPSAAAMPPPPPQMVGAPEQTVWQKSKSPGHASLHVISAAPSTFELANCCFSDFLDGCSQDGGDHGKPRPACRPSQPCPLRTT